MAKLLPIGNIASQPEPRYVYVQDTMEAQRTGIAHGGKLKKATQKVR